MKRFALLLLVLTMAVSLSGVAFAQDVTITFWTSENQPARMDRQQAMIDAFEEANPGVHVELVAADEVLMDQLMTLNVASGTLPDVVLHSVQMSAKWVADGVLDTAAATAIIDSLGVDTFSPGALALAEVEDGVYASVPSDGWGQLLVYRTDLFDAAGLAAPDSYENLMAAAQALNDPDNGFFGFCGPNAPDQTYTWQTFEHIALANGASFVDADGNITAESPEFIEALQFYADLMNSGGQPESGWYWDQTRANYFAGNCGMTIWSPFILDEMAGLRDSALPTCAECADNPAYLAENSSVVAAFTGYSNDVPAAWGSTNNIGVTVSAPPEAAAFADFWFNEVYLDALGIAAEGKFPMRRGTPDEPDRFTVGWGLLDVGVDRRAPLSDFYDAETLNIIVAASDGYSRMGFAEGFNELASAVGTQFFIQENLVAVINGDLTAEEAAEEIQINIEDIAEELAE